MLHNLSVRPVLCIVVWGAIACTGLAQFGATGGVEPPGLSGLKAVEEKDDYVYVLDRDGRLTTFDLGDDPFEGEFRSFTEPIDTQQGSDNARTMLRVDDFLYVVANPGGLDVYNLSIPSEPVFEGNLPAANAQSLIEDSGHLLAVRDSLKVLSLENPAEPQLLQTLPLQDNGWAVGGGGGYAYIATLNFGTRLTGIEVIDFKEPPTATSVGFVEIATGDDQVPYVVKVVDSLLVTCATRAVSFWSLSDPASPARIASREIDNGRNCVVYDHYLITNGEVFDLRPPFARLGSFPPVSDPGSGTPYGSIARPDQVYLAQSGQILLLQAPPAAVLPQYVNGEAGGFENRSRVILENGGEREMAGGVIFRRPEGYRVPAGNTAPPDPVFFVLPPQGSFEFSTGGTGSLAAGPAEVRLDTIQSRDLPVTLIYELLGSFVSVNQATLGGKHSAYVTNNDQETTAIALFNPNPADTAEYEATLLDNQGVQEGDTVEGSLPPGQQRAIFVTDPDLFGEQVPQDFRGRMLLSVQNDKPIYSLAIIQRADGALLSVKTVVKP